MPDFFPQSEGQMISWLENFKIKIATHGLTLGLTAPEITALIAACDNLIAKINGMEAAKAALKTATEEKAASKFADIGLLRTQIKRMKTHTAYTDAAGDDMGIKGSTPDIDIENITTVLTAEAHPAYVRIKFTKKGLDSVNIYTRLKGQATWIFLARDTNSPYDDHRALTTAGVAETREYMAIGVIDDEQVGQQSDIVSVVFGG